MDPDLRDLPVTSARIGDEHLHAEQLGIVTIVVVARGVPETKREILEEISLARGPSPARPEGIP